MTNPNVDLAPNKLHMKQCYDILNLISIESQHLSDVSFSLGELIDSGYVNLTDEQKEKIVQETVTIDDLITDINYYFLKFKMIFSLIKNHQDSNAPTNES